MSDIVRLDFSKPDREADLELVGYLKRWSLTERAEGEGRFYLHNIQGPDEPVFHDHPWDFCSIILNGGYNEATETGVIKRDVGDMVFRSAEDMHYIESVLPNTWTIIKTDAEKRQWGFDVDGKWVYHKDYKSRRQVNFILRNGYEQN